MSLIHLKQLLLTILRIIYIESSEVNGNIISNRQPTTLIFQLTRQKKTHTPVREMGVSGSECS